MSEIPESFYGHTPTAAVRHWCADCGRDLEAQPDGRYTHVPQVNVRRDDRRVWWKLQDAAAKAETLGAAVPYTGAIAKCQARVGRSIGRSISFGRCDKAAKYAVARGTDHIAVCLIHAKDGHSERWSRHSKYEWPSADEQVEPEYQ